MKVLFDHNVPHKLRHLLPGHDIRTAEEMGWAELGNGALLASAERTAFDAMVTGDKNLSYQQDLAGRALAIVVLSTNRWSILKENAEPVLAALERASPGSFELVTLASRL